MEGKRSRRETKTETMRKGEVENRKEKSAKTAENRIELEQLSIKSKRWENRIPREEISMNKRKNMINRIPHKK